MPLLHFHNGHSLEVWCGRRSKLSNWTTIAAWVTCRKCLGILASTGAARRFAQIAILERHLSLKLTDVVNAKAHTKELQEEADGLIARIRTAARDDGELPLFDMDGQ